jgi:acyl-CoA hydrolase
MKVSLSGAASSDELDDNTQVSGVGGQYNFVAIAHELSDARSILQLRSTSLSKNGSRVSNIVFSYANCTIPRHLRDIVITEYGIADLRSKTDEEVAIALIHIADSQFQEELLKKAKAHKKIRYDYQIPERFKKNTPQYYDKIFSELKQQSYFPSFPLGSDFTGEEIQIGRALKYLKNLSYRKPSLLKHLLGRMKLKKPKGLKERIQRKILIKAFPDVL